MKRCPKCGEIKLRGDFNNHKNRSDGLQSYCRSCESQRASKSYCPIDQRKKRVKYKYGIEWEEYLIMFEEQGGLCPICDKLIKPRGQQSEIGCVDHNHLTGEVRGLLCNACNVGLGVFEDNTDIMRRAIEYLEGR